MVTQTNTPPKDTLIQMYRDVLRIRHFEERVYYMFLQGILPGTIHQYQGQEAVAVGVCANLRTDDFITSTHRAHGHAIAKGIPINSLMAELYAKSTGCCHAKGGSMHLGSIAHGVIPAIAIVGGGCTVAPGLALAFRYKKTDQVAVCFFGDGAANEGAFHEGLNLAAVWKLPVIFVCENNLYAASTPVRLVFAIENIADRAAAYGMPGVVVDGNDVLAVYGATADAVARARAGEGPTLIETKTYRFCGHSRSDPGRYRPPEEVEEWKRKDPIPRFRNKLLSMGTLGEAEAVKIEEEVVAELEAAIQYAQASPSPAPQEALQHVYAS